MSLRRPCHSQHLYRLVIPPVIPPTMQDHKLLGRIRSKMTDERHIMISYQWDCQHIAHDVYKRLEGVGIDVWMDFTGDMVGNMNDAMCDAVERASIVLCFFSKKYQLSVNCRKELEYAVDNKKKDVIPIKVDNSYHPDHWLGLILGNRKYISMIDLDMVPLKIDELVCEIASLLFKEVVAAPAPPDPKYVAVYFSGNMATAFMNYMTGKHSIGTDVVGADKEEAVLIANSKGRAAIVYSAMSDKLVFTKGGYSEEACQQLLQYARKRRARF